MITTSHQVNESTHPDNQLQHRWLWNADRQAWEKRTRKVVIRALRCLQRFLLKWWPIPNSPQDNNVCRSDDVRLLAAEMLGHVCASLHFCHSPSCGFHCNSSRWVRGALWKSKAMKAPLSTKPYLSRHLFLFYHNFSLSDGSIFFYPISVGSHHWQLNIFVSLKADETWEYSYSTERLSSIHLLTILYSISPRCLTSPCTLLMKWTLNFDGGNLSGAPKKRMFN